MIDVSSSIFKVAFATFAFLLFLISESHRVTQSLLPHRKSSLRCHRICFTHLKFHTTTRIDFITWHTLEWHTICLDLRMTHNFLSDWLHNNMNLFSTSTSNPFYNTARKKMRPFHNRVLWCRFNCIWKGNLLCCMVFVSGEREGGRDLKTNTVKWNAVLNQCGKIHWKLNDEPIFNRAIAL